MHSLSKSFTSTAIGLAIQEGKLSLNDQVISFFPEKTPKNPSWQLKAMRIRDLITMNTGHIEEPFVWTRSDDWVKYFLAQEVPLKPGTHFKYNSAATYMLSAILQQVTNEKVVDYLDTRLFQPLGIDKPRWDESPQGINTGGWGLSIKTEDIAKLGQLYLQKGMWNGKRILTEEWVNRATSKQVSNGSNPDSDWEQGYGFQFWQCRYGNYRGDGAFGQYCIVMPKHNTVIAITSGVNDMGKVMNVIWETLLPAIQEKPLQSDVATHEKLQMRLKNLQIKAVEGAQKAKIAKKISKKRIDLAENETDIEAVKFNLTKKNPTIVFQMKHGEEILNIGQKQYKKGAAQKHLPFTNGLHQKVAANGAWIDEKTYQVRVYLYEMPARITYTFRFEENTLVWNSQLEYSLLSMLGKNTQQLTGNY